MDTDLSDEDLDLLLSALQSPPHIPQGESAEDLSRFTDAEVQALKQCREKAKALKKKRTQLLRKIRQNELDIIWEQEKHGKIHNATLPVGQIPDEVLRAILYTTFEEMQPCTGIPAFLLPEVMLSHVCSRWRSVALSTPRLWSCLYTECKPFSGICVDRVKTYLERSDDHPLDILFELSSYEDWVLEQFREDVLPLLASQVGRWRRFQLKTTHQETIEHLSACLQKATTSAELQAIIPIFTETDHCVNPDSKMGTIIPGWSPNILCAGAPKLQFLQLDEISVRFFRPPLDSIVHLRLEMHQELSLIRFSCITLDEILVLPQLETLSIWSDYIDFTPASFDSRASVIEAKKLKHFRTDGDTFPQYFLSHVSAPVLETFAVYHIRFSKHGMANTTPRFPSIRTLAMYHLNVAPSDIHRLMEVVSLAATATKLVLTSIPNGFSSQPGFSQNLQSVEELTVSDGSLQEVLDMVSALPNLRKITVPCTIASQLGNEKGEWATREIEVIKFDDWDECGIYRCWPPGVEWLAQGRYSTGDWGTGLCDYDSDTEMGTRLPESTMDALVKAQMIQEFEFESESEVGKYCRMPNRPFSHEMASAYLKFDSSKGQSGLPVKKSPEGDNVSISEPHKKAKEALKEKRAALLRELLETGNDIIQCQRDYGQLYNSRSAFSSLPNEVVGLIFSTLVADGRTSGVPATPLPEVVISHVCSDWRRLALSMPSLWNFFHFDGTADPDTRIPRDRLDAYLQRSQTRPIDTWLNLATHHAERYEEQSLAFAVFYETAHRLRICRLQSDDEGMIHEMSGSDHPAPMFQALSMAPQEQTIDDYPDNPAPQWTANVFKKGTPRLKYVHLDGSSIGWFKPPLETVVHLRLESTDYSPSLTFASTVLDYLFSLPQLESMSIRGGFFDLNTDRPSPDLVQSASLKHFRCNYTDGSGDPTLITEYLLSHVSAPALQSITFEEIGLALDEDEWTDTEPENFPSLQTLALRDPGLRVGELERIFERLPTIRHLIWSESRYDCWPTIKAFPGVLQDSDLLSEVEQVTIDGSLMTASEKLVRRRLASAFPELNHVKVKGEYADAVREDGAEELEHIKVTSIQPTKFPENGWIADPSWIEVGDGAFSGWEYFNCLDLS